MNIPRTIAEVRANVAACDPDTVFDMGEPSSCLISQPLQQEGRCAEFYPDDCELFVDEQEIILPVSIGFLANAFDQKYDPFQSCMTRDEALAFIDNYTKEHGNG